MSQNASVPDQRNQTRILVVDDDADFAETAAVFLERAEETFDVLTVSGPDEAMSVLEQEQIDAVVSDYQMPEQTGLDLLTEVRSEAPSLPFFLFTGKGSEDIASEAISAGVTDYLRKDRGSEQYIVLANRIQNAVSKRRAEQSLRENETFLQSVFNGIQNGLAVVDEEMTLVRVNKWLDARTERPLTGNHCHGIFGDQGPNSADSPAKKAMDSGERQHIETKVSNLGEPFWAAVSTYPLPNELDSPRRVLIQIRDISERKRREQKLEKRERLFRELHEHTKACLAADSREEIMQQMVDSMDSSLGYPRTAVLGYNSETGVLELEKDTPSFTSDLGQMDPVLPGEGPLWEAFHDGQSRVIAGPGLSSGFDKVPDQGTDFVAVPVDDYGLILVYRAEPVDLPGIDIELVNLCAANAAAILERIDKDGKLGSVTDLVKTQADRIENLRGFLRAIERIHRHLADAETQSGMEQLFVTELVETKDIDFAWISHPTTEDTDLSPTAWAGRESGYLDKLDLTSGSEQVPAQQAAATRTSVTNRNISEQFQSAGWAKEALSLNFASVFAIPIEYDGVLYGVLSVYSNKPGFFDESAEGLLADVASLFASYIGLQNIRVGEGKTAAVELELSLTDQNHPLYTLSAETGHTIQFETVLESREESVRILVTVQEAIDDSFLEDAAGITKVLEAAWFGDQDERTVLLELERPFLGTGVARHGGKLTSIRADGTEARVTIDVPTTKQVRPLIQWLQRTYGDIELVAKRDHEHITGSKSPIPAETLTDRQLELLRGAFAGGYFDSPRKITGEELADRFEISDSAVYKHLRAAQRRLLEQFLDINAENGGLDS